MAAGRSGTLRRAGICSQGEDLMDKVYSDARSALAGSVKDGMTIMAGGFGLCGIPETLIEAIRDSGAKDLTFISNNAGVDGIGLGRLLETRQIRKMISFLRRREQAVRPAIPLRRARARVQPARHARRAHPRRRRRHPGLLHQDRRRHADCRGQGGARLQRRDLRHGDAACSPTSRSSTPGRATPRATSSTARPRATSTR